MGEKEMDIGGHGRYNGWSPLRLGAAVMVSGRRGDETSEFERISSGEVHGDGCPQSCGAKIESTKGRRRGGGLILASNGLGLTCATPRRAWRRTQF